MAYVPKIKKSSITYQEIINKFNSGDFTFENVLFDVKSLPSPRSDILDFSGYMPDEYKQKPIPLTFRKCEFDVYVEFNSVKIEYVIKKTIFLDDVVFKEHVLLNELITNNHIIIRGVKFLDGLDIIDSRFESQLHFFAVKFEDASAFHNSLSIFRSKISKLIIDNSALSNDLTLTGVFVENGLQLSNVRINNSLIISFDAVIGENKILGDSLIDCTINKGVRISDTVFGNVDFRYCKFPEGLIEFIRCYFVGLGLFRNYYFGNNFNFNLCDLTNCSFLHSKIDNITFIGCKFNFNNLFDEQIIKDKVKSSNKQFEILKTYGQTELEYLYPTPFDIMETYRMFESNFDKHKDYEVAGEFHKRIHEVSKLANKEIRRIAHIKCKKVIKHPRIIKKYFKDIIVDIINGYCVPTIKNSVTNLYKLFSNYGESYIRTLFIFLLILFTTAIIYMFTGLKYAGTQNNSNITINYLSGSDTTKFNMLNDFGVGLTFSLNNSVPLKKSFENTQSATETTSVISYFETIIQTILITLFIIAIRRKFKR